MQSSFLPVLDQMTVIKIPVHLSRHILQNATLNSEEINIEKEKKQRKRHRVNVVTVKTTKHSKDEDDEKELEKQRIKEERYGQIMDDLKSLRDHYKHQYVKALTVKVNKQKKEFKEKESHMEEKLKVKEESEKRKRAEEKEMIAKGELKSNCKFKKKLKKTEYQKIIRLENKLKKQGFLNKAYEMKEFWDIVSVPGNLQKVLKEEVKWEVIKSYYRIAAGREIMVHIQENGNENENNNLVSPTCKAQNKNQGMSSFKPMTPVPEEEAVEKPKSACNKVVQGTKNKHPKQPVQSERNASLSLEQRFPKIEFPPLAAYRLMLGSDEADPDEERRQAERQQRLTSRQEHQCTINKMFTRALINKAATQRLLQKRKAHGLDTLVNVSSVKEIVVSQPIKEKTLVPLQTSRSSENSQCGKGSTSASSKSRKKRPVSNTSKVSLNTMDMLSDSEEESEEEEKFPVLPPPLAMEHLLKSCKIKEAIRPSSFWINPAFQDQAPLSQETEPLTQVVFKDSQVIPSQRVNLFERNSTLVGRQQVVNL